MRYLALILVFLICSNCIFAQHVAVSVKVDANKPVGEMKPFWSFFGYDEANCTTRKDGILYPWLNKIIKY